MMEERYELAKERLTEIHKEETVLILDGWLFSFWR